MAHVKILTDSTCDIPEAVVEELGIEIVPVRVVVDGQSLRDGVELDLEKFYDRLALDLFTEHPYTEPVYEEDYVAAYERLTPEHDGLVCIHVSKELSKTFEVAEKVHRERKYQNSCDVEIVDSRMASMGLGLIVIEAARAAKAGKSAADIRRLVERMIPKIRLFFAVPSLTYLRKGGKVSGFKSLVGSVLGAKPVLTMADGRVVPYSKLFGGQSNMMLQMVKEVAKDIGQSEIVLAVLHANAAEYAEQIVHVFREQFKCREVYSGFGGPSVGLNTGPGTTGIMYYKI